MRKMYAQLHLRMNEKKTEVGSVFGRKFLGYCFRRWSGNTVKVAVAPKALETFKQLGLSSDVLVAKAWLRLLSRCGSTCQAGSPTSFWRKLRKSSKIWIRGYATDSGPFNSSTGARGRQSIVASVVLVRLTSWPLSLRAVRDTGGGTARLD